MDWPRGQPEILLKDRRVFKHERLESRVLRQLESQSKPLEWVLTKDEDWKDWLDKNERTERGIEVILARRKDEENVSGHLISNDTSHNPAVVQHLPFSEVTFSRISEAFYLHGSIVRVINRGFAFFSRTYLTFGQDNKPAIVYNCRSSHDWPGDMALSLTHFPNSGFSYAIFYGCDLVSASIIKGRLSNSEDTTTHPLLLPGIFVELERTRQISLVKFQLEKLLRQVTALSKSQRGSDYEALAPREDGSNHAMDPWLSVHYLKNGLENFRDQILKMCEHCDELSAKYYEAVDLKIVGADGNTKTSTVESPHQRSEIERKKEMMRNAGIRIKERLQEVTSDYNEQIRECVLIMEGMTLATQLAHTKANMEIALATKKDGSQMKSIALLTMIFLPATFVATLFSMTFFSWNEDQVWIYFIVAGVLTFCTVVIYLVWDRRHRSKLEDFSPSV